MTETVEERLARALRVVWQRLPASTQALLDGWGYRLEPTLPPLVEGRVTWAKCRGSEGTLLFSRDQISAIPDWALQTLAAHELAHLALLRQGRDGWRDEDRTDALTASWGFEMGRLRDIVEGRES